MFRSLLHPECILMLIVADETLTDSRVDVPEGISFRHVSEHPSNLCTPFLMKRESKSSVNVDATE